MNETTGTLERENELVRVAAALDAAADGSGRVVIIEGPAGIGKTRLMQETRALAKVRGFGRIQATGDELESAMPWSVVRQLVERSISRYGGQARAGLMAGPSGAAFLVLHPGDRAVLCGRSGEGKSTLATALSGILPSSAGSVSLDADDSTDRAWRERVGLVPQHGDNHVLLAPAAFNLLMGRRWPPEQAIWTKPPPSARSSDWGRCSSGCQRVWGRPSGRPAGGCPRASGPGRASPGRYWPTTTS